MRDLEAQPEARLLSKVQQLTNGCAAASAFANGGRAVAHVRGSYVCQLRPPKEHVQPPGGGAIWGRENGPI